MAMSAQEQKLYNNAMVLAQHLVAGGHVGGDSQDARLLIQAASAAATANSLTLQNAATAASSSR